MAVVEAKSLATKETLSPRYNLSDEELRALSSDFIEMQSTPELLSMPVGCYIVSGTDPYSNVARNLEKEVFFEYFKNDDKRMQQEYGAYEDSSTFFVVMDHADRVPVGVMRVIEHSPAGLKTLVDLPSTSARSGRGRKIFPAHVYEEYDIDPEKCVDIATLAITKEWRGDRKAKLPSLLLYRALYLSVLRDTQKFTHTISIMDMEAKKALDVLRMPFKPIFNSDPFQYLDDSDGQASKSQAIIAKNSEFYPAVEQGKNDYERRADALVYASLLLKDALPSSSDDGVKKDRESHRELRIAKYRTLVLGMGLLMNGKATVGENEINIDQMLCPQLIHSQDLPFRH
jgi:hypothetical protein